MFAYRSISVLLLAVFLPMGAAFSNTPNPNADLQELRKRISAVSKQIESESIRRDDTSRELRAVEQNVAKAAGSLYTTRQSLQQSERDIVSIKQERRASMQRLEIDQEELGQQLRTAYALGRQQRLKLLLNQEDPSRLGRVLTWYQYVADDRARRIETVRQAVVKLERLESELAAANAELRELTGAQELAVAQLKDRQTERQVVLKRIEAKLALQGSELGKLKRNEQELQDFIDSLTQAVAAAPPPPPPPVSRRAEKPFRDQKGALRWPAKGKHIHRYGQKRAEGALTWEGELIGGELGKEVRAIADGRVVYSDWLPRLGLLTIIEHDKKYLTLYAHNQTLFKQVGDIVLREEVIAAVGDTGGHREVGLYFEIRYKGQPTNPARWCKRRAL